VIVQLMSHDADEDDVQQQRTHADAETGAR
jgi:hypothetical protein